MSYIYIYIYWKTPVIIDCDFSRPLQYKYSTSFPTWKPYIWYYVIFIVPKLSDANNTDNYLLGPMFSFKINKQQSSLYIYIYALFGKTKNQENIIYIRVRSLKGIKY